MELQEIEARAIERIAEILRDMTRTTVTGNYRIGACVEDAICEAKSCDNYYGQDIVGKLADELGLSRETLRHARQVYGAYPEEVFNWFVSQRNGRYVFGWWHLLYMARIADVDERRAFAEEALANKWNRTTLLHELERRNGVAEAELAEEDQGDDGLETEADPIELTPASAPVNEVGPFQPQSPAACVAHMDAQVGQLLVKFDDEWFGDRYDLSRELSVMRASEVPTGLLDNLDELVTKLRELAVAAHMKADMLERQRQRIIRDQRSPDDVPAQCVPLRRPAAV